uniref:Putative secreted protein n=1 Tax=Ixodes ricinus TaxID=34613 RepID=A0A6B0UFU2_IXORI
MRAFPMAVLPLAMLGTAFLSAWRVAALSVLMRATTVALSLKVMMPTLLPSGTLSSREREAACRSMLILFSNPMLPETSSTKTIRMCP